MLSIAHNLSTLTKGLGLTKKKQVTKITKPILPRSGKERTGNSEPCQLPKSQYSISGRNRLPASSLPASNGRERLFVTWV